jgi:phosphate transport system substrate-binding protein
MHSNTKWQHTFVVLTVALLLMLTGGVFAQTDDTVITLTISGSGSTQRVLSAVQEAFEADVDNYRLDILSGSGTGGGVRGVTQEILDVASMARPPKDEELENAPSLQYVEFGLAAVAIYVHPDVGIVELTAEDITAIFVGDITNWSEVGGPDSDIVLYVRDENESSTQVLRETIFGEIEFAANAEILTSQGDMEAAVEGTPASVGFGSWPAALASGTDIHYIAVDEMAPTDPANPLLKPLGLSYLAAREADVQPLIDWLLSENGQAALQAFDVVTEMATADEVVAVEAETDEQGS